MSFFQKHRVIAIHVSCCIFLDIFFKSFMLNLPRNLFLTCLQSALGFTWLFSPLKIIFVWSDFSLNFPNVFLTYYVSVINNTIFATYFYSLIQQPFQMQKLGTVFSYDNSISLLYSNNLKIEYCFYLFFVSKIHFF